MAVPVRLCCALCTLTSSLTIKVTSKWQQPVLFADYVPLYVRQRFTSFSRLDFSASHQSRHGGQRSGRHCFLHCERLHFTSAFQWQLFRGFLSLLSIYLLLNFSFITLFPLPHSLPSFPASPVFHFIHSVKCICP